jgi:hypothetical protein
MDYPTAEAGNVETGCTSTTRSNLRCAPGGWDRKTPPGSANRLDAGLVQLAVELARKLAGESRHGRELFA